MRGILKKEGIWKGEMADAIRSVDYNAQKPLHNPEVMYGPDQGRGNLSVLILPC